jgi:hypothetical protein
MPGKRSGVEPTIQSLYRWFSARRGPSKRESTSTCVGGIFVRIREYIEQKLRLAQGSLASASSSFCLSGKVEAKHDKCCCCSGACLRRCTQASCFPAVNPTYKSAAQFWSEPLHNYSYEVTRPTIFTAKLNALPDLHLSGAFTDRASACYNAKYPSDFWYPPAGFRGSSALGRSAIDSSDSPPGTPNGAFNPSYLGARVVILEFHSQRRLPMLFRRIL